MSIVIIDIFEFVDVKENNRKNTTRLERWASTRLLEFATSDSRVMADIINKYGLIHFRHEDDIEVERIKVEIRKEAAGTILDSQSPALNRRLDQLLDRLGIVSREQQKSRIQEEVVGPHQQRSGC